MKYLAALIALAASASLESLARACSAGGPELGEASIPPDGATTGPLPLMLTNASGPWVTDGTGAYLTDVDGNVFATVAEPSFVPVGMPGGTTPTAWRPAAPLPAGEYHWHGVGRAVRFFVDPELDDESAPVLTETSFRVILDRADGSSGCESSTCDDIDFTHAEVGFTSESPRELVMLELVDEHTGQRWSQLGASRLGLPTPDTTAFEHELVLFDMTTELGLGAHRICATLTPFSESGVMGEPIDLGCSNPDSGKNFTDKDGCASSQTTDSLFWLLGLIVIALRRTDLVVGLPRRRA